MKDICAHFEAGELRRKGYVFGTNHGMTRGTGNETDFGLMQIAASGTG